MSRRDPGWVPDDRLSAYLDEELEPFDLQQLSQELKESAQLRSELFLAGDARRLVRSLPMVDPEQDVLRLETEKRRTAPKAMVGLLAIAAAWVLLLGLGAGTTAFEVVPPVGNLAEQHAAANVYEEGFEPVDIDEAMDSLDKELPTTMPAAMVRASANERGDTLQVVYVEESETPHRVSVFVQPGTLDMKSRRDGLEPAVMNGEDALYAVRGGSSVVVFQRGDSVVTMVADEGVAMMDEMMDMIPEQEKDPSLLDRARGGARRFLDLVTPGF